MSQLSKFVRDITGITAANEASQLANEQITLAKAQRDKFDAATAKSDAEKKIQRDRANRKSVHASRRAMRREGFLSSSVEGSSDVLG